MAQIYLNSLRFTQSETGFVLFGNSSVRRRDWIHQTWFDLLQKSRVRTHNNWQCLPTQLLSYHTHIYIYIRSWNMLLMHTKAFVFTHMYPKNVWASTLPAYSTCVKFSTQPIDFQQSSLLKKLLFLNSFSHSVCWTTQCSKDIWDSL